MISKREKSILSAVAVYKDDLRFETEKRPSGFEIKRVYVVEDSSPSRAVYIHYKDDEYSLLPISVRGYIELDKVSAKQNRTKILELCNIVNDVYEFYMTAHLAENYIILKYQIPACVGEDLEPILREVLCGWRRFFGRESESRLYDDVDREIRMLDWKLFLEYEDSSLM